MKRYIRSATDPTDFAKLAEDDSASVREAVAQHTDDPEILAKLADDKFWGVRRAVAMHTDDPEILAKLADDAKWMVRLEVAGRTDDLEILAKLANDADGDVRKVAASRAREFVNDTKDTMDSWPDADWWYGLDDESFEDAWQEYLSGPEDEVNKELQIFTEPSVQGSMGGLFVYDESGEDRQGEDENWYVDWQEYLDWQLESAATSENASQYKKKYRKFMKDLCGI